MNSTVVNRLKYYKETLSDAGYPNPAIDNLRDEGKSLSYNRDAFLKGAVNEKTVTEFFTINGKKNADKNTGTDCISGVLCPWVYVPDTTNGDPSDPQKIALICIPAILDSTGKMNPGDGSPWIPRSILSPAGDNASTIGSVQDSETFLVSVQWELIKTWEEYVPACLRYLSHVIGASTLPRIHQYHMENNAIFFEWNNVLASKNIVELYDFLIRKNDENGIYSALLDKIICGAQFDERLHDKRQELHLSSRHYGTMSYEYPLSESQRKALHHFLTTGSGEALALNGPPGTGKTTMLQSIVAHLWVEAALARRECPLIVASSTNNQAVTNIIDSFGSVGSRKGDVLGERWVPDVHSFGLQMARESRWNSKYHSYDDSREKRRLSFFEHIETREWFDKAIPFFFKKAQEYFLDDAEILTMEDAIEAIHKELSFIVKAMEDMLDIVAEVYDPEDPDEDPKASFMDCFKKKRYMVKKEHNDLKAQHETATKNLSNAESLYTKWLKFLADESFFLALFSFLPPIRKKREFATQSFLILNEVAEDTLDRTVLTDRFKREIEEMKSHLAEIENRIRKNESEVVEMDLNLSYMKMGSSDIGIEKSLSDLSPSELVEEMDKTVRATAFRLASHYWEAQYLVELYQKLAPGSKYKDSKSPEKKARMYRRFAKLTPCQVATFHMLPYYYRGWFKKESLYMLDEIDLLIVDEAGQVSPEIGTPSFSFAKRALVVGDTHQIEPVWSITPEVDKANAINYGVVLSEKEYDDMNPKNKNADEKLNKGFLAASGNLMRMAQIACRYTETPSCEDRGLMLTEHRRCVPDIIAYCNELVYKEKLVPKREEIDNRLPFLPPIGEVNVNGNDESFGGSRRNKKEADEIAKWVKEHCQEIHKWYKGKSIEDIIGIITPFTAQKNAIKEALKKELGETADKIVVGTVHALQGAERNIILFSPTYGVGYSKTAFFDRGKNMMNVAVSRAKDSFIVIGNTALFNPDNDNPSGILSRHIRKNFR